MIKTLIFLTSILISSTSWANNITYILAAKQADLFKTQDRIADIVANANTTGYKAEYDRYTEEPTLLENDRTASFSKIGSTTRDTSQGGLTATGRQLDIAISGPGYFMVSTPHGPRFTRAGNLKLDADGVLTTQDGYPLIGQSGGQVTLTEQDVQVSIRKDGLVTAGIEERGQISVFTFANEQLLIREGKGLYRTNQPPIPTENSVIVQAMLENSNVNSVTAMTDLISVSRSIESLKSTSDNIHKLQLNTFRKLSRN